MTAEKARTKYAKNWLGTIRAHRGGPTECTSPFSSPQVLIAVDHEDTPHPDPKEVAELKTLNVTVLSVPGPVAAGRPDVIGLFLEGNSDGALFRIEQDWQLLWDRDGTETDQVHFFMEAFWLPTVTEGLVHVFEK